MVQIKKETANIWEYHIGNDANIANSVRLWKPRTTHQLAAHDVGGVVVPVGAADLTPDTVLGDTDASVVRGVVTISVKDSNP